MSNDLISNKLVLYDGYCKLCSRTVRWIRRNDPRGRYQFRPLQAGSSQAQDQDPQGETVVLLEGGKRYERSTAAIRIAMGLRFPWPLLAVLLIVPPFLRDGVYRLVARNRKKWFGEHSSCYLPED